MPEGLRLVELARRSDVGRVRDHNEDRFLAQPPLLVVADGMGGAQAGEVAAEEAVRAVGALRAPVTPDDLRTAVEDANRAIRRLAADDPDKAGMGTTVTAGLVEGDRVSLVHVGDSRAYLWRDDALAQLTDDHSIVAEMVRRGSLSPAEAELHPQRNVITRALGAEPDVRVDQVSADLRPGDVLLLCSDGLSSYVPDADIAAVLREAPDLTAAAEALVARANGAGGVDNVTVVLARFGSGEAAAGDAPAEPGPGATAEMPVVERPAPKKMSGRPDPPPAPTTEGPSTPRVLERVGRRRSRKGPVAAVIVVLLAMAAGALTWVGSRTYFLDDDSDGAVRVYHGLPLDLGGLSLHGDGQPIGVPADAVRAADPAAIDRRWMGRGEAVADAADLVWRHGLPDLPALRAPGQQVAPPGPPDSGATTTS